MHSFKAGFSALLMHIATSWYLEAVLRNMGTSFGDIPIPMQRNQNIHYKMRIMDFWMRFSDAKEPEGPKSKSVLVLGP